MQGRKQSAGLVDWLAWYPHDPKTRYPIRAVSAFGAAEHLAQIAAASGALGDGEALDVYVCRPGRTAEALRYRVRCELVARVSAALVQEEA